MKKELTTLIVLLAAVAFASGFWTGRVFPAHHYEHLFANSQTASNATYLFDTTTGKVCSAWKPFQDRADKYIATHPQTPTDAIKNGNKPPDLWDQTLAEVNQQVTADAAARRALTYIPPCGE
jgi:hypothetical protein